MADEINYQEKDVTCEFMKPNGPSENFHWSARGYTVQVLFEKILLKVGTPNCVFSSGAQYCISKMELEQTSNYLRK